MAIEKLSDQEIEQALEKLSGWSLQNQKLHRELKFPDFSHAFGFMATAAPLIEKRDHHPEWSNVYSRVTIDLTTHDSGGVTKKDIELAQVLESIAQRLL